MTELGSLAAAQSVRSAVRTTTRGHVSVECIAGYVPAFDGSRRCVPATTIAVHPRSGPPGTTITVRGSACPPSDRGQYIWTVHVGTDPSWATPAPSRVTPPSGEPTSPIGFTARGYPGRVDGEVVPGPDGRWIAHLTIPERGTSAFPATPGRYPITALCYATEGAEAGFVSYRARAFLVTPRSGSR